jgi:predicted RND superfamily exporter protein
VSAPDPRSKVGHLETLNAIFERIGAWSYDHRVVVLLVCLALLITSGWFASKTRFDNSVEGFFDTDDATYTSYVDYREKFGSDEISYVVYTVPDAPHGAFDLEAMRKIRDLTRRLEEEVPFVYSVTSLANVEFIEGVPDGLEIYELLEEFPADQDAMLEVRAKVLRKELYVGGLVSEDTRHAAIIIKMDRSSVDPLEELRVDPDGGDGLENLYPQASYDRIEALLASPEYDAIEFYHAGDVPLNAIFNLRTQQESGRLVATAFLVIGALLLFFFRSAMGVIGPLLVVALSIGIAVAVIGALGWKLDMMFIMVPTLLIAVGVADGVHIIAEFRANFVELGDRREAVRKTMRLVGTPCLLTSLTTAGALSAMAIAPIAAIANLGIYAAIGVIAAFLLSVTLLIVTLSFGRRLTTRDSTRAEILQAKGGRLVQELLAGVARVDIQHPRTILLVSLMLVAVAAAGIAQLRVDSNFLHELSKDEPVRIVTEYIDEVMGGTLSLVYLVDSGESEGIKDPGLLRDVDRIQAAAEKNEVVRRTTSVGDLLKDINRSFHAENDSYYQIPEERDLVGQYMLLYEMSGGDELNEYVTGDLRQGQLQLRTKMVETSRLADLSSAVDATIAGTPDLDSRMSLTGVGALWIQLQKYITESQILGFSLAFVVIGVMLCLLFRSFKTGLIAMVPNLAPVVLCLGAMGWLDLPLDYVRLLIGSVAIGIAVDDTIHHMIRFRLEFEKSGHYEQALRASMADVGRALFITSAVLVAGFFVFLTSSLDTFVAFGALLAGTIAVALAADFFLMPVLVLKLHPFGPERS